MTETRNDNPTLNDAIVIGGGPAGASAASVLARSMRRVLVVDAGQTRNASSDHVHGFLGLDGLSPVELHRRGRDEAMRYGSAWVNGEVTAASRRPDGTFDVQERTGAIHRTRTVVVATGLRDELPAIEGVAELWGHEVNHCPYCHGYEVSGRSIGVIGGANRAFSVHQAELLRLWSDDVMFFPDVIELSDDERNRMLAWGLKINDGQVRSVVRRDQHGIEVELGDGRTVGREALFVGPIFVPSDLVLSQLGCDRGDDGWIFADSQGATSVPGLWAAGNVTDSPAQLVHAAAQGMRTGIAMNRWLLECDVTASSRGVASCWRSAIALCQAHDTVSEAAPFTDRSGLTDSSLP